MDNAQETSSSTGLGSSEAKRKKIKNEPKSKFNSMKKSLERDFLSTRPTHYHRR